MPLSLNWICRKLALSFAFFISHVHREQNTEFAEGRGERGCGNSPGEKRTA